MFSAESSTPVCLSGYSHADRILRYNCPDQAARCQTPRKSLLGANKKQSYMISLRARLQSKLPLQTEQPLNSQILCLQKSEMMKKNMKMLSPTPSKQCDRLLIVRANVHPSRRAERNTEPSAKIPSRAWGPPPFPRIISDLQSVGVGGRPEHNKYFVSSM